MAERDSKGRFIGKGGGGSGSPVVTVGGNAQGATDAFEKVREEMRKTGEEARRTSTRIGGVFRGLGGMFTGLKSVMGGVFSFMRTVGSTVLSVLGAAYNKLKYAVLGVAGVLGYSYHAWNNEAKAQVRIGNLLRNNTRNYREAGRELDKLISRVQRTTNFADDDVRNVFGALIQTTGRRGYQIGRQLTPSIFDLSAARGINPESLAEAIGRSIAIGNSSLLRRQGIIIDDKSFARDPVAAIQAAIGAIAPGTAAEERRAAPLQAMFNNLGDVMENLGKIVATKVNPYIERFSNFFQNIAEATGESTWGDLFESVKTYAADAFEFIRAYGVAGYESLQANIGTIVQSTLETVGSGFLKIAQDFGPQVVKAVIDGFVNLSSGGQNQSSASQNQNYTNKQKLSNVPGWAPNWLRLNPMATIMNGAGALSGSGPLPGFGPRLGPGVPFGIAPGTPIPNQSYRSHMGFRPISSTGQSSPYSGGYNKGMAGAWSPPPTPPGVTAINTHHPGYATPAAAQLAQMYPGQVQTALPIYGGQGGLSQTGGAAPAQPLGPVASAFSSINSRAQQIYQQNTGRTMAQGPLGLAAKKFMDGSGGAADSGGLDEGTRMDLLARFSRSRFPARAPSNPMTPDGWVAAQMRNPAVRGQLMDSGNEWYEPKAAATNPAFLHNYLDRTVENNRTARKNDAQEVYRRSSADRAIDSVRTDRRRGALMPAF